MAFCQVLFCLLMVAALICPSHQEKTISTSFRQRPSTSLKKSTQSKPTAKTSKFKLDLKMDDSLPTLNYQNSPSRSNGRDDGREWPRNSRTTSTVGTKWYGFDNYVPRKSRSSSHSSTNSQVSLGPTMRKSYVIGEGYVNNNDHNSNQVAVRYHRQSEPELDFNLVIPQLEIDAHYRPKAQEQRQVYGNILDINKLGNMGNIYNFQKGEPNSYYQTNHNSMRPASIPVVIKIIPLKLSSSYLKEALRSMPFIPLPMSLFNAIRESISYGGIDASVEEASRGAPHRNEGYTVRYDDTMPDMVLTRDPESLPRPSSHVATPLDKPPSSSVTQGNLGVAYLEDDGSRFEYDNRFSKRTSSTT